MTFREGQSLPLWLTFIRLVKDTTTLSNLCHAWFLHQESAVAREQVTQTGCEICIFCIWPTHSWHSLVLTVLLLWKEALPGDLQSNQHFCGSVILISFVLRGNMKVILKNICIFSQQKCTRLSVYYPILLVWSKCPSKCKLLSSLTFCLSQSMMKAGCYIRYIIHFSALFFNLLIMCIAYHSFDNSITSVW